MNPYQALANAIVAQAAKDYCAALKYHLTHPNNRKVERKVNKLEDFFHSDWFQVLTDADCEYLLREMRRMVREEVGA